MRNRTATIGPAVTNVPAPPTSSREEDALVQRHLPLVRKLARRYMSSGEPLEDLVQVGCLALVKAARRYDPERGYAFTSYAVPSITGEIKRYLRDKAWALHLPRQVQERVLAVSSAAEELANAHGRAPTAAEIARTMGASEEAVIDAMEAGRAYTIGSLDRPGDDDGEDALGRSIGAVDGGYDAVEERAWLLPALGALPEQERMVVRLRFVDDLTQSEIARRLGISQMQVSRLLRRALDRMRADSPGTAVAA